MVGSCHRPESALKQSCFASRAALPGPASKGMVLQEEWGMVRTFSTEIGREKGILSPRISLLWQTIHWQNSLYCSIRYSLFLILTCRGREARKKRTRRVTLYASIIKTVSAMTEVSYSASNLQLMCFPYAYSLLAARSRMFLQQEGENDLFGLQ